MNVLLVAIDPDAIEWLALAITIRGHTTIRAGDAQTALQRLAEIPIELAIIDQLPDGDDAANQLCRRMRAIPETRTIPIWIVVTPEHAGDVIAALDAGATNVLTRPLEAEQLRSRFEALEDAPSPPATIVSTTAEDIQRLIELIPDPVAIVDSIGYIQQVTASIERLLGFDSQELTGLNIEALCHPDDLSLLLAAIREAIATQAPTTGIDIRLQRLNGSWHPVHARATRLRDVSTVDEILIVLRELTRGSGQINVEPPIEYQPLFDQTTGLASRDLFNEHLRLALARAERAGHAVAVILIEIDGENDELIDDVDIVRIAGRIREAIRSSDIAARLDHDQIVILADAVGGSDDTETVATRLQSVVTVATAELPAPSPHAIAVGSATSRPGMTSHDALLREAELAIIGAPPARTTPQPRVAQPAPQTVATPLTEPDDPPASGPEPSAAAQDPSLRAQHISKLLDEIAAQPQSELTEQEMAVIDRFLALEAHLAELLDDEPE